MGRLKKLRKYTDTALRKAIDDPDELKKAYVHLYGVSLAAGMISEKRGQDTELACMAAMLHDMYAYTAGSYEDHAHKGADLAREILGKLELTSAEETDIICSAIYHHDDKASVDTPMDEVLKDADVIHHTMNDPEKPVKEKERKRYDALRAEFGLPPAAETSHEMKEKTIIDFRRDTESHSPTYHTVNKADLVDTSFDVRTDAGGKDADQNSMTMRRYHRILWSKELPNGEVLELRNEKNKYLCWRDFSFGSDSMTTSFRYKDKKGIELKKEVAARVPDYGVYIEDYLKRATIIHCFPCHIKNYEDGYSPEEVKEVFCVPLTFLKNTSAKVYEVNWNPVFPDDFPFEKIYGGRNYGWRPQKSRIRFYEYQGRVIWGMTARIIEGFVKETGRDTGL